MNFRYWLYGTKAEDPAEENGSSTNSLTNRKGEKSVIKKGWFPSQCVIEVTSISPKAQGSSRMVKVSSNKSSPHSRSGSKKKKVE